MLAKAEVNDALQAAAGRKDVVATTAVTSSEPGSRYIDFLIPGLLGMNLMNSGMWGIGFALVDMRQRKLLKRFVGTPMRRGDFLLAIMTSRLLLMVIEIGLLLVFGVLFFHMRVLGSIFSIALLGGLGSLTFGGVGLLTASRAQKIESISGLINLVMMPMWIFSGVFFSYERFPAAIHPADQSSAAHRAERRAASQHSRRHAAPAAMAAPAGLGSLGWNFFCAGAEVVPLDLGGIRRIVCADTWRVRLRLSQDDRLCPRPAGPARTSWEKLRTRPSAVLANLLHVTT